MSRFLFAPPPLLGHIYPTIAIANALVERGHCVGWTGYASRLRQVVPSGATILPIDDEYLLDNTRLPKGSGAAMDVIEHYFLPLAHKTAQGLRQAVEDFDPDVMVVDHQVYAGDIVARQMKLRRASLVTVPTSMGHLLNLSSGFATDMFASKSLDWMNKVHAQLQTDLGVEPLPYLDCLSPDLVLLLSIPELTIDVPSLPARYQFIGPAVLGRPESIAFPWERLLPDRPKIFVSLGTCINEAAAPFYRKVIDALASEAVQVIMVVAEKNLKELGTELPNNFIVRDYVPQLELLPPVNAVLCHGGQSTVVEALYYGVPVISASLTFDQPSVISRVAKLGAGLRIRMKRATDVSLRQTIHQVLEDPSFTAAAKDIQAKFQSAGGAKRAADLLERGARAPRPGGRAPRP